MRHWSVANLSTCATSAHIIYYGSFCLRVAGLSAVRFAKTSPRWLYCWFLLLVFVRREIFLKKVVEKIVGDLESVYLCTRFGKPTGPEGPAEGLEQ